MYSQVKLWKVSIVVDTGVTLFADADGVHPGVGPTNELVNRMSGHLKLKLSGLLVENSGGNYAYSAIFEIELSNGTDAEGSQPRNMDLRLELHRSTDNLPCNCIMHDAVMKLATPVVQVHISR